MAVKSPLSNAYNVSRPMPPELSVKSLSTITSLQFLKELHWLPVQARIEYKLLTLTFKCVHDKAPTYLSELILRHVPSRPGLRSLNNISLFVPKTISRADKSTADRAFSLSAPKLWNTLPPEIRNTGTIIDFKRKLNSFNKILLFYMYLINLFSL